jgi:NADPH:quinone reductase-like Zn-dependent oxidoreductase
MKAITQDRYGSAGVLEFVDIDRPTAGDDDVLVQVHAAGLDQGAIHFMTGLPRPVRSHRSSTERTR